MICPHCHQREARLRIELTERTENGKAYVCHVCGGYTCIDCGRPMVSDPPLLSYPYEGRIERLHMCKCGHRAYLVVQDG